ncbi:MAG: hypothetical protein AAGB46_04575 [Verrucomicrobiota bacterium]
MNIVKLEMLRLVMILVYQYHRYQIREGLVRWTQYYAFWLAAQGGVEEGVLLLGEWIDLAAIGQEESRGLVSGLTWIACTAIAAYGLGTLLPHLGLSDVAKVDVSSILDTYLEADELDWVRRWSGCELRFHIDLSSRAVPRNRFRIGLIGFDRDLSENLDEQLRLLEGGKCREAEALFRGFIQANWLLNYVDPNGESTRQMLGLNLSEFLNTCEKTEDRVRELKALVEGR